MSEQVIPVWKYYSVFAALVALTFLTVGISFLELGEWHTVVGLAIAFCKALLVALIFMRLLYGNRLPWIVVGGALLWLGILLALTLADYLTRHWLAY
jgi:cytochrome c oxidase subunit IV